MNRLRAWLPAALWMGFIFLMSAAPGDVSSQQSSFVVDLFMAVFGFLFGDRPVPGLLELLLRKAAHFTEYAVLCLLCARGFRLSGARHPLRSALLLSALYAAGDELHQAFVPGRAAMLLDVAIDTLGAAFGALFARIYLHFRS